MVKRLLWIGAVVVVLIAGLDWGVSSYLKPRIGTLIQRIVVEASDSLYHFTSGAPRVDLAQTCQRSGGLAGLPGGKCFKERGLT